MIVWLMFSCPYICIPSVMSFSSVRWMTDRAGVLLMYLAIINDRLLKQLAHFALGHKYKLYQQEKPQHTRMHILQTQTTIYLWMQHYQNVHRIFGCYGKSMNMGLMVANQQKISMMQKGARCQAPTAKGIMYGSWFDDF